ncbi:hypothetical protein [Actinoallomurus rhizosphaericola]|uniref:hypothetical protein n=1 Tax=Actinoallomurus rhizosphaericola TaxID=2952536 RepID=UPI002092EBE3|nr:hypothetical protein [Actinoallomurus rhizosphaericola]MCO5995060.1 hypothetical protein [Actinoallomurus rhizosphaericola]
MEELRDPERPGCAPAVVIMLVAVAGGVLVAVFSGWDTDVMVATAFILAPVAVTPLLAVQAKAGAAALVVATALGGELATALYAAGQGGRSAWLIVIELVAVLAAPRTLDLLRRAHVPAVPAGREFPGPVGVLLIIVLAPVALAAGVLGAMARRPWVAALAAAVAALVTALIVGSVWWALPLFAAIAAMAAMLPAAARRTVVRGRHGRER